MLKQDKDSKKVLVTGGAGFLGSHLCEKLMNEGFKVICMDNFLTGRMENIEHLLGKPGFTFKKHDVTTYIEVKGSLDYVMHFASPASPIDYHKHPIHTLKVGALGTYNSLGLAKDKKAVFLLASTSEVYGDPEVNPQNEEYWGHVNPVGPRSVYDEAKRYAEAITTAYHNVHKIDVKIVRIFNTYGPRMRINDGRALPAFMCQALKNKPITVFGDGSQTRSFCYVDDLIDGIFKLLMSDINYPVNIGNPNEISILDFAKEILALTKSKSEIIFKELPINDPKVRRPDISKAKELLGWEPKVSREEGLKKVLDYFKKELGI
ncbi:SDR family oxidoreductase [candidate division WOR-3 bacterium]|nr:SDR family oxidoreductase [candidate division WOR-3 bacterium]